MCIKDRSKDAGLPGPVAVIFKVPSSHLKVYL
jgi:hypothetical protein